MEMTVGEVLARLGAFWDTWIAPLFVAWVILYTIASVNTPRRRPKP